MKNVKFNLEKIFCYIYGTYVMCFGIMNYIYRAERKKYYKHRERARNNPIKYTCIIIDGMDQSKTNVPQTIKAAKSTQNLWRLRTHITGEYKVNPGTTKHSIR